MNREEYRAQHRARRLTQLVEVARLPTLRERIMEASRRYPVGGEAHREARFNVWRSALTRHDPEHNYTHLPYRCPLPDSCHALRGYWKGPMPERIREGRRRQDRILCDLRAFFDKLEEWHAVRGTVLAAMDREAGPV